MFFLGPMALLRENKGDPENGVSNPFKYELRDRATNLFRKFEKMIRLINALHNVSSKTHSTLTA